MTKDVLVSISGMHEEIVAVSYTHLDVYKRQDENRMRYDGGQYYVKSEEEMLRLFPYAKQALENTQKLSLIHICR